MLAATRSAAIAQIHLPPTLYAPTRADWGPPDYHAGLDWLVMREAKFLARKPTNLECAQRDTSAQLRQPTESDYS